MKFEEFPKIARFSRDIVITEKIDGTNAAVVVDEETDEVYAQSRTRCITPADDNFGFAAWVEANKDALKEGLGYGRHFGEWWGTGIQRRYGIAEKRLSLFNTHRWNGVELPAGVFVVPELYRGEFTTEAIAECLAKLKAEGSVAAPGFMDPEGVVIFHTQGQFLFKKTFDKDDAGKGYGV